jgi:hypothetical protein
MANKIIVDIDVWNREIRAFKPEDQATPMPNDDVGKMLFLNITPSECFNKRQFGSLKGNALTKARSIVDKYGAINISGIYGSIEINEEDFVPSE